MVASFVRVFFGLAILQAFVASSPLPSNVVPRYFQNEPLTRRELSPTRVQQELGTTLSINTTIFGPENPAFANVTHRWNTVAPPEIELVVQPGAESDISKIVSSFEDF
jgi:hypothetical protein